MKKLRIILPAVLLVLLVAGALLVSTLPLIRTHDDVIQVIREDAQFTPNDDITISYLGEYASDGHALRWYIVQNQEHTLSYKAVDCQSLWGGWSYVTNIYDASTYAPDIVHVVWNGSDICLMNNPDCKYLVYQNAAGQESTRMEFSTSNLPYIFPFQLANGTADFLDYNGNPLSY